MFRFLLQIVYKSPPSLEPLHTQANLHSESVKGTRSNQIYGQWLMLFQYNIAPVKQQIPFQTLAELPTKPDHPPVDNDLDFNNLTRI